MIVITKLINFNQQFRLRTNELNFFSNNSSTYYWDLSFNQNRFTNWCHYNNLLIFSTAIIGIYYAKYEGLNTLKSGFTQISKNETPAYEVISGAAIAFAALLLIIPGFATDLIGFLLIFPLSRKLILNKISKKFSRKRKEKNNFIDGEFEDIEDENDKKI